MNQTHTGIKKIATAKEREKEEAVNDNKSFLLESKCIQSSCGTNSGRTSAHAKYCFKSSNFSVKLHI